MSSDARPAQARDRAAVVATAVIAIVVDALRAWLHGEPVTLADVRAAIENTLRDEFADIKREVAGDRFLARLTFSREAAIRAPLPPDLLSDCAREGEPT